jgi:hypothetical protein
MQLVWGEKKFIYNFGEETSLKMVIWKTGKKILRKY